MRFRLFLRPAQPLWGWSRSCQGSLGSPPMANDPCRAQANFPGIYKPLHSGYCLPRISASTNSPKTARSRAMTQTETQDAPKTVKRRQRTLSEARMTELVNDYIQKGKSLGEGERINVNDFCGEHNIILPLFYQISAEAGQRTGQIFPYETAECESIRPSRHVAFVGKRGNIIIKPVTVDHLNKDRSDEDRFIPGDVFDIQCDGNKIVLAKSKK